MDSRDILASLVEREVQHERDHEARKRRNSARNRGNQALSVTDEHRDVAAEWMFEVAVDLGNDNGCFVHAAMLMDNFLDICSILPNQVQLLASACLKLAANVRKFPALRNDETIVEYTDNSITVTELKAWEMLVLSKLDWDVNQVIPQDYLDILVGDLVQEKHQDDDVTKTNDLLAGSRLICDLCWRTRALCAKFRPRTVALAAVTSQLTSNVALIPATTLKIESKELAECWHYVERHITRMQAASPDKVTLTLTLKDKSESLEECSGLVERLALSPGLGPVNLTSTSSVTLKVKYDSEHHQILGQHSASPKRALNSTSPFKATTTSTPKSSRGREAANADSARRRLQSLTEADEEVNKENNDSAIGMLLNNSGLTSPPSSKSSSKQSSPDSGASSASPRSNRCHDDVDNVLSALNMNSHFN